MGVTYKQVPSYTHCHLIGMRLLIPKYTIISLNGKKDLGFELDIKNLSVDVSPAVIRVKVHLTLVNQAQVYAH